MTASDASDVPDVLAPGLKALFCGINPGRVSAAARAHFANPRNDFWRLLHEAGFTPRLLDPSQQADLLRFDPHTNPDDVDENTGTTTVQLRGGWFEFIQHADHPVYSPIATGTYTGTGDHVLFDVLEPPFNALRTPTMRWTFDGHVLHFTFLGCGNLNRLDPSAPHLCDDVRAVYEAHPWERVG